MTATERLARFVYAVVTFPQNWTAIMDDPSGATYAPATYAQATNKLRFCLAVGLREGQVSLVQFDQVRLSDPAILDTARRVICKSVSRRWRRCHTLVTSSPCWCMNPLPRSCNRSVGVTGSHG